MVRSIDLVGSVILSSLYAGFELLLIDVVDAFLNPFSCIVLDVKGKVYILVLVPLGLE